MKIKTSTTPDFTFKQVAQFMNDAPKSVTDKTSGTYQRLDSYHKSESMTLEQAAQDLRKSSWKSGAKAVLGFTGAGGVGFGLGKVSEMVSGTSPALAVGLELVAFGCVAAGSYLAFKGLTQQNYKMSTLIAIPKLRENVQTYHDINEQVESSCPKAC